MIDMGNFTLNKVFANNINEINYEVPAPPIASPKISFTHNQKIDMAIAGWK